MPKPAGGDTLTFALGALEPPSPEPDLGQDLAMIGEVLFCLLPGLVMTLPTAVDLIARLLR